MQLRSEREGRRSAVHDAEEQRRQAELVTEELRVLRQSIGSERVRRGPVDAGLGTQGWLGVRALAGHQWSVWCDL